MSDVVVAIKAKLPKGVYDGLAVIGDHLADNLNTNVVAIVLLGLPTVHIDAAENKKVDLQILRVEAVSDPTHAAVVRGLMRQIHEKRLGIRSLPGMQFDEAQLHELDDDVPEAEGA